MSKDYQVSEWRIRPIPFPMIDYARRDSMILPFLARKMLNRVNPSLWSEMFINGCKQTRKNKKANQRLILKIESN
jgi:ribonuclease D